VGRDQRIVPAANRAKHWQRIYGSKADDEVSWFEPVPRISLQLIKELSPNRPARVIDIGGGSSSLVDELLAENHDVTVLDISESALERAKSRLGHRAIDVEWIVGDVTKVELPGPFDIWHDRATFHFLTDPADRRRYVDLANRSIVSGGHAVIATFALNGPERCSGLPVERYDARSLANELGNRFRLLKSTPWEHHTPQGAIQNFIYTVLHHQ
jgi:SAM-dependent methyltransferase